MNINGKNIGVALTGSYCTFDKVFPQIEDLVKEMPMYIQSFLNKPVKLIHVSVKLQTFKESTRHNR